MRARKPLFSSTARANGSMPDPGGYLRDAGFGLTSCSDTSTRRIAGSLLGTSPSASAIGP